MCLYISNVVVSYIQSLLQTFITGYFLVESHLMLLSYLFVVIISTLSSLAANRLMCSNVTEWVAHVHNYKPPTVRPPSH